MSAERRSGGRSSPRSRRLARGSACLALGVLAGCSAAPAGPPAAGPTTAGVDTPGTTIFSAADRRPVPDLSAPTLDGSALRVRDLVGQGVVVLNVWASWCTSCREESAALAAAARSTPGARFVGIDEADDASAARRFVAASGATYPQLTDPDGVLLQKLTLLPSSGIPSTLLVDAQGRMAARVVGPVTGPGLDRLVSALEKGA